MKGNLICCMSLLIWTRSLGVEVHKDWLSSCNGWTNHFSVRDKPCVRIGSSIGVGEPTWAWDDGYLRGNRPWQSHFKWAFPSEDLKLKAGIALWQEANALTMDIESYAEKQNFEAFGAKLAQHGSFLSWEPSYQGQPPKPHSEFTAKVPTDFHKRLVRLSHHVSSGGQETRFWRGRDDFWERVLCFC